MKFRLGNDLNNVIVKEEEVDNDPSAEPSEGALVGIDGYNDTTKEESKEDKEPINGKIPEAIYVILPINSLEFCHSWLT